MADFGQTDFGQTDFGQPFLLPTLAKPTLAKSDFGQTDYGQTDFGQTDYGQNEFDLLLCCVVLCVVCVAWALLHGIRVVFHVWVLVSRFGLDRPCPGPPKISLFFSLSRRKIRSFLPSLGVFSLNFGGVSEGRDPQMCTFGLSGCRVKPRRLHQTGPPENCGGRRKKKKSAKFWAPHPSGLHPSGLHPSGLHFSAPHPSGPHPSGPHFFWVRAPTLRAPTGFGPWLA